MAAPLKPQRVSSLKKDTWWAVPSLADADAPTSTEINSVSGLNFTCFLLAEQEGLTSNTEKAQAARLLCEDAQPEVLGATTWSMSDLTGVFDPQAGPSDAGKAAFEFFRDGFTGYLVRRQGVINDTDAAVSGGQYVDAFPVSVAPATPNKTASDASGVYSWSAAAAVTGQPSFNVEVDASSSSSSS